MMLIKGPITDLLFLLLSIVTFIQFWVYWVTYRRIAFYHGTKRNSGNTTGFCDHLCEE